MAVLLLLLAMIWTPHVGPFQVIVRNRDHRGLKMIQRTVTSTKFRAVERIDSSQGNSDLLSPEEINALSDDIGKGLSILKHRSKIVELEGHMPTVNEWAEACEISEPELLATIQRVNQARHKLLVSNIRLVHSIVNSQFSLSRSLSRQELFQEGSLGLIRAADNYDSTRNASFGTYAYLWIRSNCQSAIRNHDDMIPMPRTQKELLMQVSQASRRLRMEYGEEPSAGLLASELEISLEELHRRQGLLIRKCYSLESPYSDLVVDTAKDADDTAMRENLREDMAYVLKHHLDPQELLAVQLRFGLETSIQETIPVRLHGKKAGLRSIREIATIMSLSKEHIRRTVQRALCKLRSAGLETYLSDYYALKEVPTAVSKELA